MNLKEFFKTYPKVALGFSGGVDSTYLLYAARHHGADVAAYAIRTAFQPAFELADAERFAAHLGVDLNWIDLDILRCEPVVKNTPNRCYACKQVLFDSLRQTAARDGYTVIIDGSNADDDPTDRPGMRAANELGVLSPLRMCGLSKPAIRQLSKAAGLPSWDKPAYACLATRIPPGVGITRARIDLIAHAEEVLREWGFTDFRVRLFHDCARIQIPEAQMPALLAKRADILHLCQDFGGVLLDLSPRPPITQANP